MTDHHDPDAGHLDDEAISALLDDEGAPADAAHLDTCGRCADRLAALSEVAAAVSANEPIDDDVRESTIAAVLGRFDTEVEHELGGRRAGGPGSAAELDELASRRRRWVAAPPSWLTAACLVLLVLGGAALAASLAGPRSGDDSADVDAALPEEAGDSAGSDAGEEAPTAAADRDGWVDAGDVGRLDAETDLAPLVAPALAGGVRRGEGSGSGPTDPFFSDAPPTTVAPSPGASAEGGGPVEEERADAARPAERQLAVGGVDRCAAEVAGLGPIGPLLYRATATFEDAPAVVYGFGSDEPADDADDDGRGPLRVLVLTLPDCRVVADQHVAASP